MEFIELVKAKQRMCRTIACCDCPLSMQNNDEKVNCCEYTMTHPEETEKILIKWVEEHPQKTILQDFLEKYPNAPMGKTGLPKACSADLGYYDSGCPYDGSIGSCEECWNKPMED